ncbi:MAG: hypothetical protein KGZ58_06145 [Ignavibacteriales bacterium]|nr:hypothetical protein [Ignavibacteriales bacterium]
MKNKTLILVTFFLLGFSGAVAQFKSQQNPSNVGGFSSLPTSSLFSWIDPNKFSMHHNFSMNYATTGGKNLSVSQYTNSMQYLFSDLLSARADVSMMYSPNVTGFRGQSSSFSGIFLNRAQIDFRPWENVLFQVAYRQLPLGSYYSNPFSLSGGYYTHPFGDE